MWKELKAIMTLGSKNGLGVDDIADSLIEYISASDILDADASEQMEETITGFAEDCENVKDFIHCISKPIQKQLSTQKKTMRYLRATGEEDDTDEFNFEDYT